MSGSVPNPPKGYRNIGTEPVDIHAQRWAEYKDLPTKNETKPASKGYVFAKSCDLADGVIDPKKPAGFIPVGSLANYGEFSLLGGRETDAAGNIPLKKSAVMPYPPPWELSYWVARALRLPLVAGCVRLELLEARVLQPALLQRGLLVLPAFSQPVWPLVHWRG